MLVYLFELDSVRNSPEEIKIGQQALFEEIVINGNQVVLSFNQLTDSEAFLKILEDEKAYEDIITLFRCGALKVSRYGRFRTASQYIQNAIGKCIGKDSDAFLFSGLPVKCTDTELLSVLQDALVYDDLTRLEEIRDCHEKNTEEWKRLDYIWKYIRMILILSMEKLAMNPAKAQVTHNYMDYMREIVSFCEHSENELLKNAAGVLYRCEEELWVENEKLLLNRTNWVNRMNSYGADEAVFMAEALVDLCYNYTIEESIFHVNRHFDDEAGFQDDFWQRLEKYWEEYKKGIHCFHKGDDENIPKVEMQQTFWDTAVRLVGTVDVQKKTSGSELEQGMYEEIYAKRKSVWNRERGKRLAVWFVTTIVYIFVFCVVDKGLNYLEEYFLETTVNIKLNAILSGLLDTICFGVLGSWISDKLQLVDVLQSFKNIATGVKDIHRIKHSPTQIAYRRKNS